MQVDTGRWELPAIEEVLPASWRMEDRLWWGQGLALSGTGKESAQSKKRGARQASVRPIGSSRKGRWGGGNVNGWCLAIMQGESIAQAGACLAQGHKHQNVRPVI